MALSDPEKVLEGVAKAMGMDKGASPEAMATALDAFAKLAAALSGEVDEPAEDTPPEPDAEAMAPVEDALAASVAPADPVPAEPSTEPTPDPEPAVELTTPVVEAAHLEGQDPAAGEAPSALEGEAAALVGALAEATGLAPEEVLSLSRDKLDELAAVLASAPADGLTPEESASGLARHEAALGAAKARHEALDAQIAERDAQIVKLNAQVKDQSHDADERAIDEAIGKAQILVARKPMYMSLAKTDPAEFKSQMADLETSPAVPVNVLTTSTVPAPIGDILDTLTGDEVVLVGTLRGARIPEDKIRTRVAALRTQDTGRA